MSYKSQLAWIDRFLIYTILSLGMLLLTAYLGFRFWYINPTPEIIFLSVLVFVAEFHTIFHLYGMFYCLWPRKYENFDTYEIDPLLQINVFICVCGEPAEIVESTIKGALKAKQYYIETVNPINHPKIIILNDGRVAGKDNWKSIEALCQRLGVSHIARANPGGFKAGNINNGITSISTDDPEKTVDLIFDADMRARKDCYTELVRPLSNHSIDFVQSPQRYKNDNNSWVAQASGAHQIFFFDYVCPAKAKDNALFLCGTNFAIRRTALEKIGGIDEEFITEDYATSIKLHSIGLRGVLQPKVLAIGLAPNNLKEYFNQQTRWSKGSFDTSFKYLRELLFGTMNVRQKFHYMLSATYYLIGLRDLLLVLAPLPFLFFQTSVIRANSLIYLAIIYAPLLTYNLLVYVILFRYPLKSLILDLVSFPVFVRALVSSLMKRRLGFVVTIKKYSHENPIKVYWIQLTIAILLWAGLFYSFSIEKPQGFGVWINYFWATFNATLISLGFVLLIREYTSISSYSSLERLIPKINFNPSFNLDTRFRVVLASLLFLIITFTQSRVILSLNTSTQALETKSTVSSSNIYELLVPERNIYYGYYLYHLNNHPEDPEIRLIESENPSLTMFYQDWNSQSKFNHMFMNSLVSKDVVPVITWEPWVISQEESNNSRMFDSTFVDILSGKHDDFIRRWAVDIKNFRHPVFLRFAHEMNGNWYPWGDLEESSADRYIETWRYVHDIFSEAGAENAIWLWTPNNTDNFGSSKTIMDFYPGHDYVDWVGFSGFNWGDINSHSRWKSFSEISSDVYPILEKLNKPIMVVETSSVSKGGDKADWFKSLLSTEVHQFPNIKGLLFFHDNFGDADFKLDSGMNHIEVIQNYVISSDFFIGEPKFYGRD